MLTGRRGGSSSAESAIQPRPARTVLEGWIAPTQDATALARENALWTAVWSTAPPKFTPASSELAAEATAPWAGGEPVNNP
jgi:hypothetical protein